MTHPFKHKLATLKEHRIKSTDGAIHFHINRTSLPNCIALHVLYFSINVTNVLTYEKVVELRFNITQNKVLMCHILTVNETLSVRLNAASSFIVLCHFKQ